MNIRIVKSFALNLVLLVLVLAATFACVKKENETNDTAATAHTAHLAFTGTPCGTIATDEACVTLKVTGLSHLVDGVDPTKLRTLVVPDLSTAGHTALLLTTTSFTSAATDTGMLDHHDEQLKTGQAPGQGTVFFYRTFPAGNEIDLEQSGWTKPSTPVLNAAETGDPNADCVDTATAPKESLHWLPRLTTVSKHSGTATLKDAFTKKDPSASDVVTRLEFIDGTLKAQLGSLSGRIAKFAFQRNGQPQADDHVQAVASFLNYSFKAKLKTVTAGGTTENVFVLVGRQFSTPSTFTPIARFKPVNGMVEIILANVVTNDFFHPTPVAMNDHFKHLYDIFDPATTTIARTVPARGTDCPTFPADSGVECGPDRVP